MSIAPGATIGLLGGGQLARMTAMAARSLGYGVAVLDPDPECAAGGLADLRIAAAFDDAAAAASLAERCAVVSFEIERIAEASLRAVEERTLLQPGADVLLVVQDRARQKRWLRARGLPLGPHREACDAREAAQAIAELGGPCRLKARSGGYDGRGQARAEDASRAADAFDAIGRAPCVVERELTLELELSILVARRPSGDVAIHPVARNWHADGILTLSQLPGEVSAAVAAQAEEIAREIASGLRLEGVLAVELFQLPGGRLVVNELSPRPHNTFHAADTGCATSQFEQYVRAICDLPLGATHVVQPTALANPVGDLWSDGQVPRFERALSLGGVKLHLSGKRPRRGRKVGHLLATAPTPWEAVRVVEAARDLL
jgi:5-(carboxyamino)imidazole ribonucleotide synthase